MTVQDLATLTRKELLVKWNDNIGRFQATIRGIETKPQIRSGILCAQFGRGPTPETAREDLAKRLRNRYLVIDAYKPTRAVLKCPDSLVGN